MSNQPLTDDAEAADPRLRDLDASVQRRVLEDVEQAVEWSQRGMHSTARETLRSVGRVVPEGSRAHELYESALRAFRRGQSARGKGLPSETSEAADEFETFREHLRELGGLVNVNRQHAGPTWDGAEEVPR